MDDLTISDAGGRFEAHVGGQLAGCLEYRHDHEVLELPHTEVTLEGRGVGSALVRHALDAARAQGLRVVPTCPFVAAWIDKHPDYADLIAP